MSKNRRVCAVCYSSNLIIQHPSEDMVYCTKCTGFMFYMTLENEECKRPVHSVNEDADFALALKLSEEPTPAAISHDLCTHHCPHCGVCIIVEQMNCRIFRCGEGINPHASEEEGAAFAASKRGCGKQFRIDEKNGIHKCTGL